MESAIASYLAILVYDLCGLLLEAPSHIKESMNNCVFNYLINKFIISRSIK